MDDLGGTTIGNTHIGICRLNLLTSSTISLEHICIEHFVMRIPCCFLFVTTPVRMGFSGMYVVASGVWPYGSYIGSKLVKLENRFLDFSQGS